MAKSKVEKSCSEDLVSVDIKARRADLLEELGQVAARHVVFNRVDKMEELHKRINAIDRALGEVSAK